jgi:hypothetical protein
LGLGKRASHFQFVASKIPDRSIRHDGVAKCSPDKSRAVGNGVAEIGAGQIGRIKVYLGQVCVREDALKKIHARAISFEQIRIP